MPKVTRPARQDAKIIARPATIASLSVIDNSIEENINKQRFAYLEQIRDFTYKDVVLADTKAGFALTIVGASLAG